MTRTFCPSHDRRRNDGRRTTTRTNTKVLFLIVTSSVCVSTTVAASFTVVVFSIVPLLSFLSTSSSLPSIPSPSLRTCRYGLGCGGGGIIRTGTPTTTASIPPSFLAPGAVGRGRWRSSSSCLNNAAAAGSSEWNRRPNNNNNGNGNGNGEDTRRKRRKKYERKRPKTKSEQEFDRLRRSRQATYDQIMKGDETSKSSNQLWTFETLFPEPVLDEDTVRRDLFEVVERDARTASYMKGGKGNPVERAVEAVVGGVVGGGNDNLSGQGINLFGPPVIEPEPLLEEEDDTPSSTSTSSTPTSSYPNNSTSPDSPTNTTSAKINRPLTRMVEDKLYGFRRGQTGEFEYATSLIEDGAVQFRDGVRLGNPLKVNTDRLTYFAKKELSRGRLEEAEELYEQAAKIDPRDGRAYLGLSRVAQRRRDFRHAKEWLQTGIENSANPAETDPVTGNAVYDSGGNPFLLQALGCLEEKMGNLAAAEGLFIAATRSRPSHAAGWISLAQLRTRKLRQGPEAGRFCYRTAEVELDKAGKPESSHVYTAWAALEWKAGDVRTARKLFKKGLKVDPQCSAAWLQMGVMEAERENWEMAKECFETVLTFDQKNTRVMQAYAIMESKRPEGDSRNVLGLFERALKMNPRDGGVLQAYALYVVKLGDIYAARELLRKGTIVNKRHAPIWQAWGVLETRHGKPEDARNIFQQGIWACAQPSGGQSGGRRCARLWQAWGVLEAQEEDHAAARRCFSRALDADSRNVAAVTAWTVMEKNLGNYKDARLIFERALKQFSTPTDEKLVLWQAYEAMESVAGNSQKAQSVYQRSIGDAIAVQDEYVTDRASNIPNSKSTGGRKKLQDDGDEVEVSRWDIKKSDATFGQDEVWMNDGSIEGKVPRSTMKKKKNTL